MTDSPLQILYRDEHYVAVHKPAGLLVHRSPLDSRETRFLVQLLRDQIGQRVFPVHRLDKPTQGAIVLALDSEAARLLQERFESAQVDKTYLAVVRGYAPPSTVVDHALRDGADARVARTALRLREAVTGVRRLDTIELPMAVGAHASARYSLVECRPRTGRRHQIRRHMKHLRHPIVGDANYGDGVHNRLWRDRLGIGGLLLAATELRFVHPYSGEAIAIAAPIASPLAETLRLPQWSAAIAAPAPGA